MSPFQALYGFPPPLISELAIPGPDDEEEHDFLTAKQQILQQLKREFVGRTEQDEEICRQ